MRRRRNVIHSNSDERNAAEAAARLSDDSAWPSKAAQNAMKKSSKGSEDDADAKIYILPVNVCFEMPTQADIPKRGSLI